MNIVSATKISQNIGIVDSIKTGLEIVQKQIKKIALAIFSYLSSLSALAVAHPITAAVIGVVSVGVVVIAITIAVLVIKHTKTLKAEKLAAQAKTQEIEDKHILQKAKLRHDFELASRKAEKTVELANLVVVEKSDIESKAANVVADLQTDIKNTLSSIEEKKAEQKQIEEACMSLIRGNGDPTTLETAQVNVRSKIKEISLLEKEQFDLTEKLDEAKKVANNIGNELKNAQSHYEKEKKDLQHFKDLIQQYA